MSNTNSANQTGPEEPGNSGETTEQPRETAPGFGVAQVILKPRKAGPFVGRHPWVFRTAVARFAGDCQDGDVVDLVTDKRKFLGRGILNRASHLRVRLYAWDAGQPLDEAFWQNRLDQAICLRDTLQMNDPAGACRLVNSEADGLSGLIVDRYADRLVIQVNAAAIASRLPMFVSLLAERLTPSSIVVRTDAAMAKAEAIEVQEGTIFGKPPERPIFIVEHGLRYGVDLTSGQKTGFYLDQRDNRRVVAGYLQDRRVLDMFCYSGGFSLCASRLGNASESLGIDVSDKAIAWAQANAQLNGIHNARFQQDDCFQALQGLRDARQSFDAVILDPPKFARSKRSVADAIRAYHRINRLAIDLLRPDGILVTCSCSGSVTREDFLHMLAGVVQKSGREVQIIEQRGPSADHPLSPVCLENEYLKCFICRVV